MSARNLLTALHTLDDVQQALADPTWQLQIGTASLVQEIDRHVYAIGQATVQERNFDLTSLYTTRLRGVKESVTDGRYKFTSSPSVLVREAHKALVSAGEENGSQFGRHLSRVPSTTATRSLRNVASRLCSIARSIASTPGTRPLGTPPPNVADLRRRFEPIINQDSSLSPISSPESETYSSLRTPLDPFGSPQSSSTSRRSSFSEHPTASPTFSENVFGPPASLYTSPLVTPAQSSPSSRRPATTASGGSASTFTFQPGPSMAPPSQPKRSSISSALSSDYASPSSSSFNPFAQEAPTRRSAASTSSASSTSAYGTPSFTALTASPIFKDVVVKLGRATELQSSMAPFFCVVNVGGWSESTKDVYPTATSQQPPPQYTSRGSGGRVPSRATVDLSQVFTFKRAYDTSAPLDIHLEMKAKAGPANVTEVVGACQITVKGSLSPRGVTIRRGPRETGQIMLSVQIM